MVWQPTGRSSNFTYVDGKLVRREPSDSNTSSIKTEEKKYISSNQPQQYYHGGGSTGSPTDNRNSVNEYGVGYNQNRERMMSIGIGTGASPTKSP
jgi:hypothetical protein